MSQFWANWKAWFKDLTWNAHFRPRVTSLVAALLTLAMVIGFDGLRQGLFILLFFPIHLMSFLVVSMLFTTILTLCLRRGPKRPRP